MAIVIIAAGVVPKFGAASIVGLTSGILAGFLGMGDFGALNTFLSYTAVGIGADLALLLLQDPENPITAALSASLGHMGQIPGQMGTERRHRRPGGLHRLGIGARDRRLRRLRRRGRPPRRADAQGTAQGRFLRLYGGETVGTHTLTQRSPVEMTSIGL